MEDYRLPKGREERLKLANTIGADGWKLVDLLSQKSAPTWLQALPAVQTFRWIWEQQFHPPEAGGNFEQRK